MAIFNSYVSLPEGNGLKMFFHVGFAELCKLGRGITAEYSSNLGLYTQENWHSWGYKWGELYKHMAKKRTSVQISAYVYTHTHIYIYTYAQTPIITTIYIYIERSFPSIVPTFCWLSPSIMENRMTNQHEVAICRSSSMVVHEAPKFTDIHWIHWRFFW